MRKMTPKQEISAENSPHWLELASDNPLFSVNYKKAAERHVYSMDFSRNLRAKKESRNMNFEVVFPLYMAITDIIQAGKTAETTAIQIIASSKEHWEIVHVIEFPVNQWTYTQMDSLMSGLAGQLVRKQNLNGGLLIKITF